MTEQTGEPFPAAKTPTKKKSWYKRPQAVMAVVGSVIALATFFAKERLQEHWRRKAEEIRAAQRALTTADESVELRAMVLSVMADVEALGRDAYALEQHKRPTAETERRRPGGDPMKRELLLATRDSLYETEPTLEALQSLSIALDEKPKGELASLKADLGEVSKQIAGAFRQASVSQDDLDGLIYKMTIIENRTAEIRAVLQEAAEREREKDERHAAWTNGVLSVLFVLGLALSLMGKLGGVETELPEI